MKRVAFVLIVWLSTTSAPLPALKASAKPVYQEKSKIYDQLIFLPAQLVTASPGESTCPGNVQSLTSRLLRDLPGYANRVIQRAALLSNPAEMDVYVIMAGRPEFDPLSLAPGQDRESLDPNPPEQVFFTTLERQYLENRVLTVQNYHWLFLTYTSSGWRMAMLYTRLGSPTETVPPRPPLETSDSIIGQAVKLWLRDCRAGTTRKRS